MDASSAETFSRVRGVPVSHRLLLRRAELPAYPEDGALLRWRLAFPVAFLDEVRLNAAESGLDPALLLAIVRHESGFRPEAESRSGALGLAQLMPRTASDTARRLLGEPPPARAELLLPDTNLRLAARYLATLLARSEGNAAVAVAAYNAGPGRVARWLDRWGDLDTDELVEALPWREAHGYTKQVLQAWGVYRYLYGEPGDEAARGLPLPRRVRPGPG